VRVEISTKYELDITGYRCLLKKLFIYEMRFIDSIFQRQVNCWRCRELMKMKPQEELTRFKRYDRVEETYVLLK
jgi:hypothetical protein